MHQLLGSDQSVVADQGLARCLDPFLAVCCKRQVGDAGVPPIKGPFCLAVTDNEATGCHFCHFPLVLLMSVYVLNFLIELTL